MARYRGQEHSREIEIQEQTKKVVNAVSSDVKALISSWNGTYPQDYSKQVYTVIRASQALQEVSQAGFLRNTVLDKSAETFLEDIRRDKRRIENEEAKKRQGEMKIAFSERSVVLEKVLGEKEAIGDLHIFGERVLVCVSCEYLVATPGEDGVESGWLIKFAAPTEEEKSSEAFKKCQESIAIKKRYEQTMERQIKALAEQSPPSLLGDPDDDDLLSSF